jgi:chaperone required for assembly of F1-ATPase
MGKLFVVPNEALALAVAAEWNMQEVEIKKHLMYLVRIWHDGIVFSVV